MLASTTIALLSAFALLDVSFARPTTGESKGIDNVSLPQHPEANPDIVAAQIPPAQAVAMVPVPIHNRGGGSEPLPRRLSRRSTGVLPTGHRPADLGADISMIPNQRSMEITERKDLPIMKRHDHILSPEAATVASCNVGEAQCCQSIHQNNGQQAQFLTSLLGLALPADGTMVGVQCTPIASLLALGGSKTCSSQPICCSGNKYKGLINMGCSPISV